MRHDPIYDSRGKRDLVAEKAVELERSLGGEDASTVRAPSRRQGPFHGDILAAGLFAGASASLSLATALGAQARISRPRSGANPSNITSEERKKDRAKAAKKRQRQARRASRRAS